MDQLLGIRIEYWHIVTSRKIRSFDGITTHDGVQDTSWNF